MKDRVKTSYTNPRRTGTGHVHSVRTLFKASTESTTTRYIREFKTSFTVLCRTRRATDSMRNTGYHSCSGTLAPPVADPRSWSQPCAVPSMQCCYRRHTTMSRTSRTGSTRTRTKGELAILLVPDHRRIYKQDHVGSPRPWLSVDICADQVLSTSEN